MCADVIAEPVDTLAASSNTTPFLLSVRLWEIRLINAQLIASLLKAVLGVSTFPSFTRLDGISELTACIRQSTRMAQAVPSRLLRAVPEKAHPLWCRWTGYVDWYHYGHVCIYLAHE